MLKARVLQRRTSLARNTGARTSSSTKTMATGNRTASVKRATKETKIDLTINIDGTGKCHSKSQIPFLDHMMDQLASSSLTASRRLSSSLVVFASSPALSPAHSFIHSFIARSRAV